MNVLKYSKELFMIVLFVWISFFPQPIQDKYHIYTSLFLILALTILYIKKKNSVFSRDDYPLWIFLIAVSLNVFFAQQKVVALKTYLNLAIPMLCIYYLTTASLDNKQFNILSKIICVVSILVALGGLMDFLLGFNFLYEYFMPNPFYQKYKLYTGYMPAISTQFHNPPLGSYLITSLPFNLLLTRNSRPFFKLLGLIGTTLVGSVIIMTLSRGVFFGLVVMILFILYSNNKRRLLLIFLASLCVFIIANAYMLNPLNRLGFKQFLLYGSTPIFSDYRLQRLLMVIHILKDHPFVGLGLQHFRIMFTQYYPGKDIIPYEFMIADNMYLTFLAEAGIMGFLGFVLFISLLIKKAWRTIKKLNYGSSYRQQLVVVLAAFIGLLINMGAYELLYWSNQYICFCILAGCLNALAKTDYGNK